MKFRSQSAKAINTTKKLSRKINLEVFKVCEVPIIKTVSASVAVTQVVALWLNNHKVGGSNLPTADFYVFSLCLNTYRIIINSNFYEKCTHVFVHL